MRRRDADSRKYESEAEMCSQFMSYAGDHGYVCYPETAGWDILLVRRADGVQIGVQAKLQANLDVLQQCIKTDGYWCTAGPDYRAVLVPHYAGKVGQLQDFCPYLSITVITAHPGHVDRHGMVSTGKWGAKGYAFSPQLPDETGGGDNGRVWFELCPSERCGLPQYVPDVRAGVPSPLRLTHWKISAIKIAVILERRGYVRRSDFKHLRIDHRRWIAAGPSSILIPDPPYGFKQRPDSVPGMGFKADHPRNYDEIAADFDAWAPPQ